MIETPRAQIGTVWTLSLDPPVFLTGIVNLDYLGIARPFSQTPAAANSDAGFIVFPTWTLERTGFVEAIRADYDAYRASFPRHKFRFLGNTYHEAQLLGAQGLPAMFLNKNFTVSDRTFRPLPDIEVEFDAIYNARYIREKRHELAALVPRVAYLAYSESRAERVASFQEIHRQIGERTPDHVLLNEVADGRPVTLDREGVNAALARAAVGLMLSAAEGSNYASMEYMLAGLPVVSTPSIGGRDVYYDPDFCLVCDPDPVAVRDAVATLIKRDIPRSEIRARALARIGPARQRFLELIDTLLHELGAKPTFAGSEWPFGRWSGVTYDTYDNHLEAFAAMRQSRDAVALHYGLPPQLLDGAQLEAQEIDTIAQAIRSRPGCRLLVFGCGNDSAFWEALNAEGETAFIEDDPTWAEMAMDKLSASPVYVVSYGTQLSQWRGLLDMPRALKLDLPLELTLQKWDIIIVDGPEGFQPFSSGRMKSIFTAAKLVAPGGVVFVHDVQREPEAAYAAKYLGEARVVAAVQGRALLKGYAF